MSASDWRADAEVLRDFLSAFKNFNILKKSGVTLTTVVDKARSNLNRAVVAAELAAERNGATIYLMDPRIGRERSVNLVRFAYESFRSRQVSPDVVVDYVEQAIARAELRAQAPPEEGSILDPMERLEAIHPLVLQVSKDLFVDGHNAAAILEASKAVGNRVKQLTRQDEGGKSLMMTVFNEAKPLLRLNEGLNRSQRDEQEGFKFVFAGAILGIRNPKAHDHFVDVDADRAHEYLALASLLEKVGRRGESGYLGRGSGIVFASMPYSYKFR